MDTSSDALKSMEFALEYLKITRGVAVEIQREDALPEDLIQGMAQEHLQSTMEGIAVPPESLIYGLVALIEILIQVNMMPVEVFFDLIETSIAIFKETHD